MMMMTSMLRCAELLVDVVDGDVRRMMMKVSSVYGCDDRWSVYVSCTVRVGRQRCQFRQCDDDGRVGVDSLRRQATRRVARRVRVTVSGTGECQSMMMMMCATTSWCDKCVRRATGQSVSRCTARRTMRMMTTSDDDGTTGMTDVPDDDDAFSARRLGVGLFRFVVGSVRLVSGDDVR